MNQEDKILELEETLRAMQQRLQANVTKKFQRRVPFGDLISDRWENAKQYGFGEGSSCYDNVLILGDVKVGRNTWIGPSVILDGSGTLLIGNNCSISSGVQIYTHHTVKWATSGGNIAPERKPTVIGSSVYIGPNSIVQMGVTIGDGSVIGAMSLVTRDIPAGMKAWGIPAHVVGRAD
jgi:acetyltransferase-like isoleucine patch superfamily enzyme